jgi:hypothetical protein
VPGSGIFLPIHRATKRSSPTLSADTLPPTPTTPSYEELSLNGNVISPPTTSLPKFSQSVGPGARPHSPVLKPKHRPSLPRPESPFRKQPTLAPTPGRGSSLGPAPLSKSQIGGPRFTPSPGPKLPPKSRTPQPISRPFSRNNSRLGFVDESTETTPTPVLARSSDGSNAGSGASSGSTFTTVARHATDDNQEEIQRLKKKLEERDRQLKEQASSLADMENSLSELQNLIPSDGSLHFRNLSNTSSQDSDAIQLRAVVREKNEKITMLTAEFDAHRADFRSTIDTLELASTETARVYEHRVEELMQEVRDLQDGSQDVESVARQLKQLEDLVQELEEGLEDARRGEAEARGEVEFLRGEVERTRAELRRERERNAAALRTANAAVEAPQDSRDLEQRDDEIRGLKAIIHSLSSGGGSPEVDRPALQRNGTFPGTNPNDLVERLEREKKELQGLIERKGHREEELERELERLRGVKQRASVISNGFSDRTATQDKRSSGRDSKGTVLNWRGSRGRVDAPPLTPMAESDTRSNAESSGSGVLWCEICENSGHDILTCTSIDKDIEVNGDSKESVAARLHSASISSQDPDKPKPLTGIGKKDTTSSPLPPLPAGGPPTMALPTPYDASVVAGKDGSKDPNKWCALCERDGHDSINCAFEGQFDD